MRRVRRKVGNKEKVFGCDLLEHLNASSQEVPQVLRCCSEFVETHGIVDGIYRLSGVSSNIQKLRGEFESDGSPDLNKDVYLQDIHCVSSLCKAYFRELPNPLLTYQLYDKFAEAVAIQLEEERLVKIRDVLKELPKPHYRTLEFLMRHLVKMASFSSETNMHARNLAIVWAPNLLRSKDIEASGFNGTAVFKEVRVQSIVVEFILTHVPQLFPNLEVSGERRKSLPSPSAAFNQEEGLFKSGPTQLVPNIGNISPGAGPLAMRPYHAIIEGTDKRKGSLKGRKWMSIFNIGGRFHEQRRRHKHSAKEKDRPTLRSARSMDSLSDPSYPNEGLRRTNQHPPPTNTSTVSPLASSSSSQSGSDASIFSGAIGGSEYAVTYRRGTGCVGSAAGTQGTYTALDPEGTGATYNETVQTRSPGHSTKVGRRAAMHITGPTMVTVPLHITSNLALGVLQGGGGSRVIHRGRDKDGADRVEGKEGEEKAERRKNREIEWNVKNDREVEEEEKSQRSKAMDVAATPVAGASRQEDSEGKMGKEKVELVSGGGGGSREHRVKSLTSNTEEDNDEDVNDDKVDDYMGKDVKSESPADLQTDVTQHDYDDCALGASNILNSTAVEGDDLGLSGYVQDSFEFLDQMDCSVLDHMDQCVPYQVNEFSVEPPGHSYDEYEVMEQTGLSPEPGDDDYEAMEQTQPDDEYEMMGRAQTSHHPPELHTHLQPGPGEQQPHRLLSIDANTRHVKSLSLPYMTSPVHGPEELGSEEECGWGSSDDNDYSSEEDCSMCVKSLPLDFILSSEFEKDIQRGESCAPDEVPLHQLQISEGLSNELPACKETAAEVQRQEEVKADEEGDGPEVNVFRRTEEEDKVQQSGTGDSGQSKEGDQTEEEEDITAEDSQISDESSMMAGTLAGEEEEEKKEAVVECPGDDAHFHAQKDTVNSSLVECTELSMNTTEQPRTCAEEDTQERGLEEEDLDAHKDERDAARENFLEIKEGDGNVSEGTIEEDGETVDSLEAEEKMQDESRERDFPSCSTSSDIWDELQDVVCEVIEEEESRHIERESEEDVAGRGKAIQNAKAEETEERERGRVSEERRVETDGGETETEVRLEIVEETTEEKVPNAGREPEFEENDTNSIKTKESDEKMQRKQTTSNDSDVVFFREGGNDDEQQNKQPGENMVRSDMMERMTEDNDGNQGGVGSKIVVFKHPKIHQVKAVPVVPPKPQHCRITALALRQQQQQQKEKRDTDRGWDNLPKFLTEQDTVCGGEQEKDRDSGSGTKEKPTLRGEETDRERWRDADENAVRDVRRNSPLSMCFDEAVAKATMRREKEKEYEKERQREWGNEGQ